VLACVHGQANVSSASEPACCPPHGQWDVLDVHLHRFFRLVVRVFVRRAHIRPQQARPPAWGAHPTDLSYSFCFCWPASHCRGLGLLCCVASHPIRISHTRTARCDRRRPHTRASSPELLLKLGPLLVRLPLVPAGRMEGGRNAKRNWKCVGHTAREVPAPRTQRHPSSTSAELQHSSSHQGREGRKQQC